MFWTVHERLQQWAFSHHDDRTGLSGSPLRSLIRFLFILVHVFRTTHLSLRASALTYSIILSLVPMLALSTAILKGLGSGDALKTAAYQLLAQLDPEISENGQAGSRKPSSSENPEQNANHRTLSLHLRRGVETVFDYVERTNFAALGAFGIGGLLILVLLMLNSVESTMNAIWQSRTGRSLGRRIMNYLALLVLLPISINIALAGSAILQSDTMMRSLSVVIPSRWLIHLLFKGVPFLFVTLSLSLMYAFFPSAKVRMRASFAGALIATVGWFSIQKLYLSLQFGVAKYNAIYGSFATIPLFLIWLHLGWIFLLLGAAVAYAIQNIDTYRPLHGSSPSCRQRIELAYEIVKTVYDNFAANRATSMEDLAGCCAGRLNDIIEVCHLLVQEKVLLRVEGELLTVAPAMPVNLLDRAKLVTIILDNGHHAASDKDFAGQFLKSVRDNFSGPLLPNTNQTEPCQKTE